MIRKNKTIRIRLIASVLLLIFVCVFAAACQSRLKASITITKGSSEKFSGEEIDSAIDCVIESFNKDFKGNTLTDVWYDEERSDRIAKSYYGYSDNNVIVLLSNIKSGGSDVCGGFDPNQIYSEFNWILLRNDKDSDWAVKTSGY